MWLVVGQSDTLVVGIMVTGRCVTNLIIATVSTTAPPPDLQFPLQPHCPVHPTPVTTAINITVPDKKKIRAFE